MDEDGYEVIQVVYKVVALLAAAVSAANGVSTDTVIKRADKFKKWLDD